MARPVRPVLQVTFLLLMTLCLGIFPLTANAQAEKPVRSEAPVPLAPAPPKSPQVQPDGSVAFNLAMPNAAKVELHLEGAAQPFPMTKGPDGVWSVTVPKLAPQYYSYTFNVDGTSVLDPHNVTIKPSFFSTQNVFPGARAAAYVVGDWPTSHTAPFIITTTARIWWPQTASITFTPRPTSSRRKNIPCFTCFTDTATIPAPGLAWARPTSFSTT